MSKKLASYVTVHDEGGVSFTFAPGDDLPKWAKAAITNPNVWASDGSDEPDEPDTGSSTDATEEPPRGGAGSGEDAWRTYATGLGIDVPEDAKKADILDLVDAFNANK